MSPSQFVSALLEVAIGCSASFRGPDWQIVEGDNFQSKCSKIQCIYLCNVVSERFSSWNIPTKNEHLPYIHFSSWHFQNSKTQVSGTRSITIWDNGSSIRAWVALEVKFIYYISVTQKCRSLCHLGQLLHDISLHNNNNNNQKFLKNYGYQKWYHGN